jgi:hypothetical protein
VDKNPKKSWTQTEKCILPLVRIAKKKPKSHSNQKKEDRYIVANVYQNTVANVDFKLKYAYFTFFNLELFSNKKFLTVLK